MPQTFMPKPLFRLAATACACALAFSALAVEFGPLKLKSALGDPLHAEIELRPHGGDLLDIGCIKASAPSIQHLPTVTDVTLSWLAGAMGSVLTVRSGKALLEPAMVFSIEVNCGAGRVWQEFPVLLSPLARYTPAISSGNNVVGSNSEWVVASGESPLSLAQLLYPGQRAVQRRFIRALAALNPGLGIDDTGTQALLAGSSLLMPDWKSLGAGAGKLASAPIPLDADAEAPKAPVKHLRAPAVVSASPFSLRLAMHLLPRQEASEPLRQILRLEYRLLGSFNEQLSMSMETAPSTGLAAIPAVHLQPAPILQARSMVAGNGAEVAVETPPVVKAAEEKVEAPPAPIRIRQVPDSLSATTPNSEHENDDWIYLAGGSIAVLILLILFMRRRRHESVAKPVFHSPETVVMSNPPPSVMKAGMEAFYAEPAASNQKVVRAVPLPPAPAPTDPNPVMELAEIMLSFGRLEGAAQTLQEYIEANPKETLQPWMKLLEIYRAGGMQAEFDDLAKKLNHNFNVEVQSWSGEAPPPAPTDEEQLFKACCLEELPHIIEQLVAKWGQPGCLDYLHQLLRDNRGGQRSGFALPVVQEILLLIEIMVARQAAGNT